MDPVLLRAHEVAELLAVGRSKVFEMMAAGELPVVRLGRAVRVPRAAFNAWLQTQTDAALANTRQTEGR